MTMKMARVLDVRESGNRAPEPAGLAPSRDRHISDILARYPAISETERQLLKDHADKHGVGQMRRSFVSRGLGPQLMTFERNYRSKSALKGRWGRFILALIIGATLLQALH